MKKEKSSTAIFATSFVISLAALLIIIMLVLSATMLSPKRLSAAPEQPDANDLSLSYYRPTEEEAFSMLLIHCKERSAPPYAYTLLHFDPVNAEIALIAIPPETEVSIGTRTDTLNGQYDYAGSDNAKAGVSSLLLTEVDCYARIDGPGSVNLIDALGGLEKTLETPYRSETLSLPVGNNLLNGTTLYGLLSQLPNSIFSSEEAFLKELLEQRLTPALADKEDYLFTAFLNNTDTDATQFGYAQRKKAMRYYLSDQNRRVTLWELSGTWSEDEDIFYPDAESVKRLHQIVGNPST